MNNADREEDRASDQEAPEPIRKACNNMIKPSGGQNTAENYAHNVSQNSLLDSVYWQRHVVWRKL